MIDIEETPKKHILCYGDSNTWGYIPASNGTRFATNVRWPGVLSKLLRTNYRITEEGLSGRTTVWDDPYSPGIERNGYKTLGALMESHKPLDLVIIMLGTNDLKYRFSCTAFDIAQGAEVLARAAFNPVYGPGNGKPPDILIVCPPPVWEVQTAFGPEFKNAREKSFELHDAFRRMSKATGLPLMFSGDFIASDPSDGIHLSEESHSILGQEVAKWILEWFEAKEREG
jgi:Lysophospholipase L1 and related esterases